ncbi:hypothetical protein [Neogemmobacter tilapiae]|uniref:Uncharacterized protein n=1 Tax=Neogemmobacter tilapiae TaxID=875041 RepID=A0A918THZ3_9RHOB|nr:hypothetical protein [Gemmobacter tilapiae]GHC46770.1 hypothetical protein GCM10007315_05690 [Gemmobacter tilapiae]
MKKLVWFLGMMFLAGNASAKVLECTTAEDSWVNSPYIFGYEANTTAVTVYDPVIHTFVGEPIAGKYEESSKKIVFKWSVQVKIRGDQTNMGYRASFFPADGKFTVRATPGAGYTGHFEGRGTCKVKEQ